MPDVRPFRALFFDSARAGDVARNVAEPYDKVTEAMRESYLRASPNNVVRVDLPREDASGQDRYRVAGVTFRGWIEQGVVRRTSRPAFYLYEQEFDLPGEPRHERRALVALVEAREHGKGNVVPHERTFREPKADRMALLEAARAHFGMCFLLYEDPEREIGRDLAVCDVPGAEPLYDFTLADGSAHRLFPIEDRNVCAAIRRTLASRTCTIADGHHRYETAIAFRREHEERGDARPAHAYRTAAFVDVADPGLRILPTHRLLPKEVTVDRFVEAAAPWFERVPAEVEAELSGAPEELGRLFSGGRCWVGKPPILAIDAAGKRVALRPRDGIERDLGEVPESIRPLAVTHLHKLVLERGLGIESGAKEHALGYVRWPADGMAKLRAGEHGCMVLLNPTTAEDVLRVAEAGATMPQKSTDFYPKLLSGLVMNDVEDELYGA